MFTEVQQSKRNIIYIRGILSLVITLLAVYQLQDIMQSRQHVLFYIAALIASNFVFMLLPDRLFEGTGMHNIMFITDIVFIALGAYWLASLDFLFMMMIFASIFIAALSKSVKFSVVVALVVNVFYYYIKSMTAAGEGTEPALEGDIVSRFLNAPFLFMVALHASYMAERADEELEGLKRLKKSNVNLSDKVKSIAGEMEQKAEQTEYILDSFREGVIVMDTHGVIRHFNKKCEAIFGMKRGRVLNILYREIKDLGDLIPVLADTMLKHRTAFEKELVMTIQGQMTRLTVNTVFVNDREDKVTGYLCTIRQKTSGMPEGV